MLFSSREFKFFTLQIHTKMKTLTIILSAGIFMLACNTQPTSTIQEKPVKTHEEMKEHGKYLVSIMGCNDCHTSKIMTPNGPALDTNMLLAGHPSNMPLPPIEGPTAESWVLFHMNGTAMKGPWGISYAANLTPDTTGIAAWTEAQFFRAMRHGDSKGIEDEDLHDVLIYLKSIKPVKNVVPQPQPPVVM
jgi:hypothetical protein